MDDDGHDASTVLWKHILAVSRSATSWSPTAPVCCGWSYRSRFAVLFCGSNLILSLLDKHYFPLSCFLMQLPQKGFFHFYARGKNVTLLPIMSIKVSSDFHDIPQNPIFSKGIPLLLCSLGDDAWKSNSMRSSLEIHRRAPTHGKTNSICWSLEIHGRWTPIAMKWWNG